RLHEARRRVVGRIEVLRVVIAATRVVAAAAHILVQRPELMPRLVGKRFDGPAGWHYLEPASSERKGLLKAAAGGKQLIRIVSVVHNEDRRRPVGAVALPREVIEGPDIRRKIPSGIEPNLVQKVIHPAFAAALAERVAGKVIRDA